MDIISNIKPSKEEKKLIENASAEVIKKLKKIRYITPIIGGSISKDTYLKGTDEVDIFIKFNYKKYKNKTDKISEILYKDLKKLFKVSVIHGSRDYFHVNYKGLTMEIVPIIGIKKPEQALNVTDLSPLHIKFVKKYPKLKDDIRLLKAFCKANYLYGAESYISGFSGYAIEVLVIYYKSFKNVLKNSLKWKQKTVIDCKKELKNALSELNSSKTVSPLIIIDPVDKTRNISASLSMENFNKFKDIAKKYLKNPSEKFFKKDISIPNDSFILKIIQLKGKKDIVGSKIVKVIDYVKLNLNKEGFKVTSSGWFWENEATFWFKVKNKSLPKYLIHKGPPINLEKHAYQFKKKYSQVFVKNKFLYAKITRKITNVKKFVNKLLKDEYVKERVKNIKLL
ncbi:CCA tRNA nucleotidyltransferase [Candidatus Woesearchaeota archaeon]|nr:CCA tRNA nucleotidyltransferase [Candidatus Woesearchaeota archaeon]